MAMIAKTPPKVHFYFPQLYYRSAVADQHHHPFLTLVANAQHRYGDIYTLNLGLKQAVVVTHPHHAHHILRSHAGNYRKGGALMTPLRTISGAGVTTSSGQQWREQRQTIQPFFQHQHLVAQLPTIITTLEQSLAHWASQPLQAIPINGSELMAILTGQLTATLLLHSTLPVAQIQQLRAALTTLNQQMLQGILLPGWPVWAPLPGRRRYQLATHTIHDIIEALIVHGHTDREAAAPLFTALQHRAGLPADVAEAKQQLHDEVLALFIASYETTATCLSWACYLLGQHPAVLATVQQEIDQVIGTRQPTYADLAAMKYLDLVLFESLRLYPPSWRLSRVAVADDVIDGFQIRAGQSVLTLVYLIQRHPGLWSEPTSFHPERFADQQGLLTTAAWFPFGLGSRKCVGEELALLEMKLILVMLLQRYQLAPYHMRHPGVQLAMTLKPRHDLWFTLTTRPLAG